MLKIFNTLTKKKEKFSSILTNKIKLYVCGITVYELCHIGHGRTLVIFDTIIRYFKHCGYQVHYTRNITDIDDKIIKKAQENKETTEALTNRMIQAMHIDLDSLNIIRPNYEPKVTEHIDAIIEFIYLLVKNKHAYLASNGDVMFSVKTAQNYGMLSSRRTKNFAINDHMNASNNIQTNSADFVLWKKAKSNEPYWMSPWGIGRPGWHIECSAMSYITLGKNIDIHGGGSDLIFPHHENEIAQSICAHGAPHVNIWMHAGMLNLKNIKMSKSLNNFYTIREILQNYDSETLRYFFMSAHYRNRLQYNDTHLRNARLSLERLYISLKDTDPNFPPIGGEKFIKEFFAAMNDDFNTPKAYSILFKIAHKLNYLKFLKNDDCAHGMAATLKYLANILGLLTQNPIFFLKNTISSKNKKIYYEQEIIKLIQDRENARIHKQWQLADKIRKKLHGMGVKLEDTSSGVTQWSKFI